MSADEVRQDLLAWIVANATQPCSIEDIHSDVSMCDAGYIDSIRGADLLAHIERRYAVRVEEVELVGRLQTLDELVAHVAGGSHE